MKAPLYPSGSSRLNGNKKTTLSASPAKSRGRKTSAAPRLFSPQIPTRIIENTPQEQGASDFALASHAVKSALGRHEIHPLGYSRAMSVYGRVARGLIRRKSKDKEGFEEYVRGVVSSFLSHAEEQFWTATWIPSKSSPQRNTWYKVESDALSEDIQAWAEYKLRIPWKHLDQAEKLITTYESKDPTWYHLSFTDTDYEGGDPVEATVDLSETRPGSFKLNSGVSLMDHAVVFGEPKMEDEASLHDNAQLGGKAVLRDQASVIDQAVVQDRAEVSGVAIISGNAQVLDQASVGEEALVTGDSILYDRVYVGGEAVVDGATLHGDVQVGGKARLGHCRVSGVSEIGGTADIDGGAVILGGVWDGSEGPIYGGVWRGPGEPL